MRELPAWARVLLLASSGAALLVALAQVGTGDDPYAPNDWVFSHVVLAQHALDAGAIPLNRGLLDENTFVGTVPAFKEDLGIERMTFYANAVWHFWNGLPLQPALLATLSALGGMHPEDASRVPIGAVAVLLLLYASADLLLAGSGSRAAALAPFALALCSAPLVLDLRVLMPSTSLVVLGLLLHLLLRRALLRDEWALAWAMLPLAMLPFWYYTVSYFAILLFVGFLVANVALRLRGSDAPPVVPLAVAAVVPVVLVGALSLNGALTSHLNMASTMGSLPFLGTEAGGDYGSHLNRQPWRSALLYLELALLFAPLALVALVAAWRLARRDPVAAPEGMFAQWAAGGVLFSIALPSAAGVSFLNRSVIYLTPLAVLALCWALARRRLPGGKGAIAALLVVGAVVTPVLVATAAPTYSQGDREAFEWMDERVPKESVVYSSLDASSVLFRRYGFEDAIAFHPRTSLLEDFWYGADPDKAVPYLSSVDHFVLRDDARHVGFEEFGPLRQPLSDEAYGKFDRSRDLHLVYDNGEVKVYQVGLAPDRFRKGPGQG